MAKAWSVEDDAFLRDHYSAHSNAWIADQMGRSVKSIELRAIRQSLKKPLPTEDVPERFGRFRVLKVNRSVAGVSCEVVCDCGAKRKYGLSVLKAGDVVSCGCHKAERASERLRLLNRSHGLSKHPLYKILKGMHVRCFDPDCVAYHRYGGRGIRICDEWNISLLGVERAALNFIHWGESSGYKPGLTIERENNDLGYSPDNCSWATRMEQGQNTSKAFSLEFEGETKSLHAWARDSRCVVQYDTLRQRLSRGWSFRDAFTNPNHVRPNHVPG